MIQNRIFNKLARFEITQPSIFCSMNRMFVRLLHRLDNESFLGLSLLFKLVKTLLNATERVRLSLISFGILRRLLTGGTKSRRERNH